MEQAKFLSFFKIQRFISYVLLRHLKFIPLFITFLFISNNFFLIIIRTLNNCEQWITNLGKKIYYYKQRRGRYSFEMFTHF